MYMRKSVSWYKEILESKKKSHLVFNIEMRWVRWCGMVKKFNTSKIMEKLTMTITVMAKYAMPPDCGDNDDDVIWCRHRNFQEAANCQLNESIWCAHTYIAWNDTEIISFSFCLPFFYQQQHQLRGANLLLQSVLIDVPFMRVIFVYIFIFFSICSFVLLFLPWLMQLWKWYGNRNFAVLFAIRFVVSYIF